MSFCISLDTSFWTATTLYFHRIFIISVSFIFFFEEQLLALILVFEIDVVLAVLHQLALEVIVVEVVPRYVVIVVAVVYRQ